MKKVQTPVLILIILVAGLLGYIVYDKFSFTEEMARETAKKVFNLLMIKGAEGFQEVYPSLNNGSRIVTNKLCRINNVTKRDDGDYDVYASYEHSKLFTYPIHLVVNRHGNVVKSNGLSYAYFDKTLEFAKKIGCLTGLEDDVEIESIISRKNLRKKLDDDADLEWYLLNEQKIKITGRVSNSWGYISGNAVVKNNSPISFDSWDLKCSIEFLSSSGEVIDSDDIFFTNLPPYGSVSSMIYSSAGSAVKIKYVTNLQNSVSVKNKIKEYIINNTSESCF